MKQVIQGICPIGVIAESYKRLGNVWKVAEEVGLCGQTVHDRLTRAGLINKLNRFTDADKEILKAEYKKYRDSANLKELAAKMGRTVPFITRKAKELGLTDAANRVSMKPLHQEKIEAIIIVEPKKAGGKMEIRNTICLVNGK
jgi:hypothetical protein